MSNSNIKCSLRIDGFVGQKQNTNSTQAGLGERLMANGLELFFFFKLFSVVSPINAGNSIVSNVCQLLRPHGSSIKLIIMIMRQHKHHQYMI